MVETRELIKRYGSFEALHGISLKVGRGEVVGLLGPNGAGKTTLMRILACYHRPSGGTAVVDSVDVTRDPLEVKRRVGYLPESSPVYQDLKVVEYLRFVAALRGLPRLEGRRRIDRVIVASGLQSVVYRDIRRLSKGYRQRVGLAQAILHDPSLLILDEPTSGLDPGQISEIRELIRGLGSEKTVILSSHILNEVESLCGRVVIVSQGAVAAEGRPQELSRSLAGARATAFATVASPSLAAVRDAAERLEGGRLTRPPVPLDGERYLLEIALEAEGSEGVVFDWAVSNGLKLLGLTRRTINLEEVFLKLTREGEQGA